MSDSESNDFIELHRESFERGYVQVYTGDGKGKTTASMGLALRAAGAGLSVFIAQFIKCGEYSEIKMLKELSDKIECCQYGRGCWLRGEPDEADRNEAQAGFEDIRGRIESGRYQLVILDEINVAVWFELLTEAQLLELVAIKPFGTELVFTGRKAPESLIQVADLVTEMKEIKHYYQQGVLARKGIES